MESDEFTLASLPQKMQIGEEVAAEEFQHFIKKGVEMIQILQNFVSLTMHNSIR